MNNKGNEQVISVYWFAILIIVAVGISAMVFTFYNHPYDVRELEANILMNKVADCISEHGVISKEIINDQGEFQKDFDMQEVCSFNFKSPDFSGDSHGQYYVLITFNDSNGKFLFDKEGGDNYLRADCLAKLDLKDEKALPGCVKGNLFAVDLNGKQYLIEILTGVSKSNKNVRI